jgi:hypothetical protein
MKLTSVDSWTNSTDSYRGKYRDEQGLGLSGLYRRDYKKSSEMLIISNGNLVTKYKYPKVQHSLDTQMLNWGNVHFIAGCGLKGRKGELICTDDLLIEAVISGLKPIGFLMVEKTEVSKYIKKAIDNGLKYSINPHCQDGYCEIGLANKGKLEDYINFSNLLEAYSLFSNALGYELIEEDEREWLYSMAKLQLADFICGFNYLKNGKSDCEDILTGLLLGYPIESTVAFMDGKVS